MASTEWIASAVAPWASIRLPLRLQARGRMGDGERVDVSMGADRKANTWVWFEVPRTLGW